MLSLVYHRMCQRGEDFPACETRRSGAMQCSTSGVYPAYIAQCVNVAPSFGPSVDKPDMVDVIDKVEGTPTAGPGGTE